MRYHRRAMRSRAVPAEPARPIIADDATDEGAGTRAEGADLGARPGSGANVPVRAALPLFDDLYRENWRYVAAIAERLILRREEVRDVVQDVFLRAYRGLDKIENAAAVRGWLATITVRAVTDRLRRRKWQQALMLEDSVPMDHLPTSQAGPDQIAELRAVYVVLDRMPVKERVAWTLRYVEQEPLDEVAKMCGCSLATAKRRIAAAQEKLRALDASVDDGRSGRARR